MGYWIDQLGFWGYMKKFPINPITIIGIVIIIGILVLIINASVRKSKADQYLTKYMGAAVMTFYKKNVGNTDYADTIRIAKLNDETAQWFFLKPGIPAIYLKPGENKLEVHSEWARGGRVIKMYKTEIVTLQVYAEQEGCYSLEYYIPDSRYIFEPYNNPKLFGK